MLVRLWAGFVPSYAERTRPRTASIIRQRTYGARTHGTYCLVKIGLDFPRRYYPRSFLGLLLLAFLLVAAPLIIAFYNAAVYVEQLAGQSQTAVAQAAQASRGSRLLVEQTTALERVVRQYVILDDEELLKDYARLRANFKANTSELSLQPLDETQLAELNHTIDMEQALY